MARTLGNKLEVLKRTARSDLPVFCGMLKQALADRSPSVRSQAVLLVTEHRLTGALPLVVELLEDRNSEVRYDAAECVGLIQKDTGIKYPTLRSLLSDGSYLVRAQAAESLALIGDNGALPDIARLLSDRDPMVRSYAAGAIADLNGTAYAKHIERALTKEKQEQARVGLLEAAFLFGRRDALEELLGLLRSRDYHVRCSAANSLEFLPLKRAERARAAEALNKAARSPLAFADASAMKRVLKRIRRPRLR
jgi:HEAT repeat protein